MSLRIWRQHWLTQGLATFLALLVCGTALDWAHPGGDDPDCNPTFVVHKHNAHRFGSQTTQSSPEGHCFICHSLRSFHSARTARGIRPAPPQVVASVALIGRIDVLSGHAAAAVSRGPPAVHL